MCSPVFNPVSYTHAILARDSTEAFEDVGHSDEARALLKDMLVGDFEKTDVRVMHPCVLTPC